MLTKEILLRYKAQNPSKYEHKYGHIDLDSLPDTGAIDVKKSTSNFDGTPARPTVGWKDPIVVDSVTTTANPLLPVDTEVKTEVTSEEVVKDVEDVVVGDTLENKSKE